jgi:hypothetical protein
MAGIAPLSGSASTSAGSGISDAPPTHAATVAPKPNPADAGSFTAFPNSYAGFGENGSSFGTISVVNGRLSVVSADPGARQPQTSPAATGQSGPPPAVTAAPADTAQAAQPQAGEQAAAILAAPSTPIAAARPPAPADHAGIKPPSLEPTPGDTPPADGLQPPTLGKATAAAPLQPAGQAQSDPTQGLLGSVPADAIPGASAPNSGSTLSPEQGLLGAPATNPIVIQAEDQERSAAAAAAVEANQAAAAQQADHIALQQINARIAAARAAGNAAAVAQLQPRQAAVIGDLQGQTFAGVGSTPPKPFARPEIPTVFLNIAS